MSSIGSYTTYQQTVITIFMILSGVNFNVYFLFLLKKIRQGLKNEELRAYLGIILGAILLITVNIAGKFGNPFLAFHHAAFQVGSIITTTGYPTVDFNTWPTFSKTALVLLMLIGASAGSTGGGVQGFPYCDSGQKREERTETVPSSPQHFKDQDGRKACGA